MQGTELSRWRPCMAHLLCQQAGRPRAQIVVDEMTTKIGGVVGAQGWRRMGSPDPMYT